MGAQNYDPVLSCRDQFTRISIFKTNDDAVLRPRMREWYHGDIPCFVCGGDILFHSLLNPFGGGGTIGSEIKTSMKGGEFFKIRLNVGDVDIGD